jgi:protocatechuate 3,4-dioxygenase alpha subunit
VSLPRTPSQTVGPFFEFGLSSRPLQAELVSAGSAGAITIEGRVLDSAGAPVPDGLVEIWQADAAGRYDGSWGWGRCATDADGHFAFTTVKPGAVREPDGHSQAPHATLLCFARGLLKPVLTRVYFPDEAEANAADPVLRAIADDGERATLIAAASGDAGYRFDVKLQGGGQTVFFTTPASGL